MTQPNNHTAHHACKEVIERDGGKAVGCCCTGHDCKRDNPLPSELREQADSKSIEEFDLHSDYALGVAERFHNMMKSSKTSFTDISGEDIWKKLYYSGMIPNIIRFFEQEYQRRIKLAKPVYGSDSDVNDYEHNLKQLSEGDNR